MWKFLLLKTPRFTSIQLRTAVSSLLSGSSPPSNISTSLPSPSWSLYYCLNFQRSFSIKAFNSKNDDVASSSERPRAEVEKDTTSDGNGRNLRDEYNYDDDKYPSGEFEFREYGAWKSFVVKCRLLFALPWERVQKGSVLTMKLRGQISDQLKRRLSSGLSLPQICQNFIKAAYDPRISGVYLHIDPLNCGWGKVEEIRRHILDFKKSGKFIVGYAPACREKEYYIGSACEELYAPPSAYFALYGLTVQASFLGGILGLKTKI